MKDYLAWEAIERAAATAAKTHESRDDHLLQAERHADRAWSIREGFDEDGDIAVDDDGWVLFKASPSLNARLAQL